MRLSLLIPARLPALLTALLTAGLVGCGSPHAPEAARLKTLSLSADGEAGIVSPCFDSEIFGYTVNVPRSADMLDLSAEAASPSMRVEGAGPHPLLEVENLISVTVSGGGGAAKAYRINARRAGENACPNNRLASLSVSGGDLSPAFDCETADYELLVESGAAEVSIAAEAERRAAAEAEASRLSAQEA